MPLSWFLSVQFLKQYRSQAILTISAVAVGVAVMVFLSALITGLQANLIESTLGTQAQITIRPQEEEARPQLSDAGIARRIQRPSQRIFSISQWQRVLERVGQEPGVVATSAAVTGSGFALRGNASKPVAIQGIVPEAFNRIIPLGRKLSHGKFQLDGSEALIGTKLSSDLGVGLGDKLRVRAAEGPEILVTIRGIFDLGNQQVNERWVILPLRTSQSLLDLSGGANVIYAKVEDIFEAEAIAQRLKGITGLEVESWMSANQQLLVALRSQSSSSYTIQFFLFLAVAMGIASVLVVSVVQRTREIGILRAMGVARITIAQVFILQGAIVGLVGSLVGSVAGAGLSLAFSNIAKAPDGSATFPMALSWQLFAAATTLASLTGVLAAAMPARRAARLEPVEAIRGL